MKVFVESFHVPGEAAAKTWIKWLIQYFSNWIKISNGLDKLLTIVLKNPTINEKVKRHQHFILIFTKSARHQVPTTTAIYEEQYLCGAVYVLIAPAPWSEWVWGWGRVERGPALNNIICALLQFWHQCTSISNCTISLLSFKHSLWAVWIAKIFKPACQVNEDLSLQASK